MHTIFDEVPDENKIKFSFEEEIGYFNYDGINFTSPDLKKKNDIKVEIRNGKQKNQRKDNKSNELF